MSDLAQVQVEDVLAVVLGRRAEPDVAAHAAWSRQRRIERFDGRVAGADEVDLLVGRLRPLQAQRHAADPLRDDVAGVHPGVQPVHPKPPPERRAADAVHHDEQRVERPAALAEHATRRDDPVDRPGDPRHERGRCRVLALRAHREQPVAPFTGLDHQIAAGRQRAVGAVEAEVVDAGDANRIRGHARAQRGAALADGIDLVDEDDALAAPLARKPLGLPRHVAHGEDVHPDEHPGEARPGDRDEGAVETGGDGLGQHRLARARRAQHQQAALALAARLLELVAGLPQRRRRAAPPPWPRPGRARRPAGRPSRHRLARRP